MVVGRRLLDIALFGAEAAPPAVVRMLRTGVLERPSGRVRWRGRMQSVLAERHGKRGKPLEREPQNHQRDSNDSPTHEISIALPGVSRRPPLRITTSGKRQLGRPNIAAVVTESDELNASQFRY